MFPTRWSTLVGILFMFGTIRAFLVPSVHEAVPYYDQSIPAEMIHEEDNTNENPETPIITVVKKPKQTFSGSIRNPNIFWRTPRNTKDPVFVFSTLLNHQWLLSESWFYQKYLTNARILNKIINFIVVWFTFYTNPLIERELTQLHLWFIMKLLDIN